jgi:hypothetical protein
LREALPVSERGVVRWWRVIATGFVAMIATVVVGAVAVLSFTSRTPYDAGHLVGTIAFPAAIAGGVFSYLGQRGTKLPMRIVAFVGIVAGVVAIANLPKLAKLEARVEQSDRVPLVDADGRLTHPTLGFSIAKPANFIEAPQLAAAMTLKGVNAYAYVDHTSTERLIVMVDSMSTYSKEALESYEQQFRAGVQDSIKSSGLTVEVVKEDVSGDGDHLVGRSHFVVKRAHMHVAFYPIARRGGWLCVVLMFASAKTETAPVVLDSFRAD